MRWPMIAISLLLAGCATNPVPASHTAPPRTPPRTAEILRMLFRSEGTPMALHSSCRKAGRRWDATTMGRYVAKLVDYNLVRFWIAAQAVAEETAAAWRVTVVFHTEDDFLIHEEEIEFLAPRSAVDAAPDSFRCRYSVTYLQELPEYER